MPDGRIDGLPIANTSPLLALDHRAIEHFGITDEQSICERCYRQRCLECLCEKLRPAKKW